MTVFNGVSHLNASSSVNCVTNYKRGAFVNFSGSGSLAITLRFSRQRAVIGFAGSGLLAALATSNTVFINFAGAGSITVPSRYLLRATVSLVGLSNLFWQPTTIWPAVVAIQNTSSVRLFDARLRLIATSPLAGRGSFVAIPEPHMAIARFSGSSSFSALAFKPNKHLIAHFSGSGAMNVITVAPRLVASAQFIGYGSLVHQSNTGEAVLSTANSLRYSFPTIPSPSDPFVRRPSKDYRNYSGSVRLTGSGRITAIAS